MATLNPYSGSLLMDAFRGSLSNAESLGRGFAVAPVGLMGDVNALARQYITPRLPQSVQGLLQAAPAAPTTEQILSNIPRVSAPRMETSGMEQLGAAMNFKGPVDVARGAGRVAGNAINEAMVYDRGLLAGITPQPMRMDVYHGSPYGPFTKFDPSKARTGEGNATFGEGAYLAQARGTGETYRNVLSASKQMDELLQSDDMPTQIAANTLKMYKTPAEAIDVLQSSLTPNLTTEARKVTTDAINVLKNLDENAGYLYKVDLPDESIAKMLDYDKPLSKQAPEVQSALAELGIKADAKRMGEYEDALLDALTNPSSTGQLPKQPLDLTGEQILKELERNASRYFPLAMEGKELTGAMINPRAGVSELLGRKGVTGVRYLDQMSRDVGDGTSNFVVFPQYQDLLTIKEINDQAVGGLLGR